MPNNDLHVHFRRADVAETVRMLACASFFSYMTRDLQVCRLRATVYINGVGSVQLSWSYGDKF